MKARGWFFTDSGGIQEETTALGVPCITLRDTTERPITAEQGTNTVVGQNRGVFWLSFTTF
jgi:UDP-N-acetylglucosamine 2-epimerase (non-hydrolysing)